MAIEFELVLFATAIGFVTAACAFTAFGGVRLFSLLKSGNQSIALHLFSVPFTAFIGPFWVAKESYAALTQKNTPTLLGAFGLVISTIWSFCAGVIVVEILHLFQIV